jgi:asparagine synthase (glutamine-hydrolysing)
MCGLTGYFGGFGATGDGSEAQVLRKMTQAIMHRGPDSDGHWLDADAAIALGHRRLAIVDLSAAGAQPMQAASGRYVIAFNGEIYNHLDLRTELEKDGAAPAWRGHADTETLLAGFDAWGIEATLRKCIGMFAIALWDRKTRTLSLARDRLGEKPLYYGWQGSGDSAVFLFGSELKALRAHPAFQAGVDRDALSLYLRHMAVPGGHSIYQGIHKLQPGCLLTVSLAAPQPVINRYWSAAEVAVRGVAQPFAGTAQEAVDELEMLLKDAVRQQMMADVPLGAFLSGGVDSSTVVALMQAQSNRAVKTFSIGFHEEAFNEAEYAKAVARHLGTDHTELYVTAQQAMDVIPRLPALYDEPFADSSQIPTHLVSQLARRHVTVSLSGDAGDELFCGYTRYTGTERLWRRLSAVPMPLRQVAAQMVRAVPPAALNALGRRIGGAPLWARLGDRLHKGTEIAGSRSLVDLYRGMVSNWHEPESVVIGGREPATLLTGLQPALQGLSDIERLMALDLLTYLPDDILTKVDRAAMGASLETRVPFLDHRIIEFAWRLPLDYKLRKGVAKWPLRQVLYRHVPRALIDRPKRGFAVPLHDWLRGPLREWAEHLLGEQRLEAEGYFHAKRVRSAWIEHLSGHRNWSSRLWIVLMFQAWLDEQNR